MCIHACVCSWVCAYACLCVCRCALQLCVCMHACVYMHMCMHACVGAHMCVCRYACVQMCIVVMCVPTHVHWRPHMCLEPRSQCWVFSVSTFQAIFWEKDSYWNQREPVHPDQLSSEPQRPFLSLLPQYWDYGWAMLLAYFSLFFIFIRVLGIKCS